MIKAKSTPRQQAAFKLMLSKLMKHEPVVLKEIMREVGYSEATAINPGKNLTDKPGWDLLKRQFHTENIVTTYNELSSQENQDKRTRLAAADSMAKAVAPEKSNNINVLFDKLGELQEEKDDKPEDPTEED